LPFGRHFWGYSLMARSTQSRLYREFFPKPGKLSEIVDRG